MDENKDTIKIEVKKSLIATLAFVILHLIVIAGWGFSIFYVSSHPAVIFYRLGEEPNQYYEENWGKDSSTVWPKASAEDEAKRLAKAEGEWFRYTMSKKNKHSIEATTCMILTSFFSIILYLEWFRRLPKKE